MFPGVSPLKVVASGRPIRPIGIPDVAGSGFWHITFNAGLLLGIVAPADPIVCTFAYPRFSSFPVGH